MTDKPGESGRMTKNCCCSDTRLRHGMGHASDCPDSKPKAKSPAPSPATGTAGVTDELMRKVVGAFDLGVERVSLEYGIRACAKVAFEAGASSERQRAAGIERRLALALKVVEAARRFSNADGGMSGNVTKQYLALTAALSAHDAGEGKHDA